MKTELIDGVEYISTAELNACLPYVLQAKTIEAWGFTPRKIRAGYWWRVADVELILRRVADLTSSFLATVRRHEGK
jgi:hypothetical protein